MQTMTEHAAATFHALSAFLAAVAGFLVDTATKHPIGAAVAVLYVGFWCWLLWQIHTAPDEDTTPQA